MVGQQRESSPTHGLVDAMWSMRSLGIVIHDPAGRIIDANQRFARLLGYAVEDVRRLDVGQFVHPDARGSYDRSEPENTTAEPRRTRIEPKLVHRDGRTIWARIHKAMIEIDGERCVLVCVDDCTIEHDRLEVVEYEAGHDPLTGAHNRRGWLRAAERRLRTGGPHVALLVQVERLGNINAVHGAWVGDALLCEVATSIRAIAGGDAIVGRLFGGEFIVLTDPGSAVEVVRRIRSGLEIAVVSAAGDTVDAAVAVVSVCARPGTSAEDLLAATEKQMRERTVLISHVNGSTVLDSDGARRGLVFGAAGERVSLDRFGNDNGAGHDGDVVVAYE